VTIGTNGRVRADVFGNTVIVEGEVDGNLFAQQQAIVRQSGAVRGNITAPRVMLEDGSRFRGSIDMESKEAKTGAGPQERPPAAASGPAGAALSGSPAGAGAPAVSSAGQAGQLQPAGAARGGAHGG
jgi:predicted acyltransferase (DUF342 family)